MVYHSIPKKERFTWDVLRVRQTANANSKSLLYICCSFLHISSTAIYSRLHVPSFWAQASRGYLFMTLLLIMSYMDFSSLSHGEVELTTHVVETALDTWTIKKPRHISPKLVVLRALVHLINLQAFALLIFSEIVAEQ